MKTYDKIQSLFKREEQTKFKQVIEGDYSLPEFKSLEKSEWEFTEKIDGTNIRIIISGGDVEFRGKTDNASIPTQLLNNLRRQFDPIKEELNKQFPFGACLYGEGCGPKIQKGGEGYGDEQRFIMFDIKVGDWWLKRFDIEGLASAYNIDVVPVIGYGTLDIMTDWVKQGFMSKYGHFIAEGIIAKTKDGLLDRAGRRIITKLKYKDFNL